MRSLDVTCCETEVACIMFVSVYLCPEYPHILQNTLIKSERFSPFKKYNFDMFGTRNIEVCVMGFVISSFSVFFFKF